MTSSCCDPAQGIKSLSVDFANTVACSACRVGDGLASEAAARRWLADHESLLGPTKGAVPLADLLRFRTIIRGLFDAALRGTPPRPGDVKELNRWARAAPSYTVLSWGDRSRSVAAESLAKDPKRALLAKLATCTAETLGEMTDGRLRRCEGEGCDHFIIARTAGQRWCSVTGCGNRARAARHYLRVKAKRGPAPRAPPSLPSRAARQA